MKMILIIAILALSQPAFSNTIFGCGGEGEAEICEPAIEGIEYESLFIEDASKGGDELEAVFTLTVVAIRGCAISPACVAMVGSGIRATGRVASGLALGAGGKRTMGWF
jgi:hypothetical protein